MKTTLLLLSFLLFASYCSCYPVLDITNKELVTGAKYYIYPYQGDKGGGLTLASTRNKTCPFDVVMEPETYDHQLLVTFHLLNTKNGAKRNVINQSTNLSIKFLNRTRTCSESTVWKVDDYDESMGQYFVTTGGVEGGVDDHGKKSMSSWFKIEIYDNEYKLVHCPKVCKSCNAICKSVGAFYENGKVVLALSDTPLTVLFQRVLKA